MSISDAQANIELDALYGSGSPANIFIGLFTTLPAADGTGGVEVTGGSYARASVVNNDTNWPDAVAGVKSNGVAIDFPTATADWGVVVGAMSFDGSGGGANRYDFGALDTDREILNGDDFSIAPTQFEVSYD
jgi:hypothetical protein